MILFQGVMASSEEKNSQRMKKKSDHRIRMLFDSKRKLFIAIAMTFFTEILLCIMIKHYPKDTSKEFSRKNLHNHERYKNTFEAVETSFDSYETFHLNRSDE